MNGFDGILEFVAVAETQGFTSAAKRVGVSTSQISRSVAGLEQRLGVALLARTTRKVRLTDAGQQYYLRCRDLVYGLEEANESLTGDNISLTGTLRISAAGEFAEQFIAPAMVEFAAMHPQLSIDMNFNSRMVDFVEEGIDFSLRYGRLSDSSLVARKLVDRSLMAAASSSYLEKYGIPTHPSQLEQHQCIIANNHSWLFEENQQPLEIKVKGQWRSNSGRSLVKACEQGLGICYIPVSSYGEAIKTGKLVPILEPFWTKQLTTWIVYSNRKFLSARARLAINFLLHRFRDWKE